MAAVSGFRFSKIKLRSQWFFHHSCSLRTNILHKWVNVCLSSQIAKQQQQLIQQQHKINLLQQQIQVGCPPDIFNSLQRWSLLQMSDQLSSQTSKLCRREKKKEAKVFFVLRCPSRWTCPTWWSRPSTPTPSPFRWPLNPRWHCHCSRSPVSQVSLEVSQEAGRDGMGHTSLLTQIRTKFTWIQIIQLWKLNKAL